MKAFYRQRTPESDYARKENVDIDILITSRRSDIKIIQHIRIMSEHLARIRKQNWFSQFRFLCVVQCASYRQMTIQLLYLPEAINFKILVLNFKLVKLAFYFITLGKSKMSLESVYHVKVVNTILYERPMFLPNVSWSNALEFFCFITENFKVQFCLSLCTSCKVKNPFLAINIDLHLQNNSQNNYSALSMKRIWVPSVLPRRFLYIVIQQKSFAKRKVKALCCSSKRKLRNLYPYSLSFVWYVEQLKKEISSKEKFSGFDLGAVFKG